MKVEVLGTGGAISDLPTAYLINENTLVDCGMEIVKNLIKNKKIDNINNLFITHFHMDHVSGLELFIFYKRFSRQASLAPLHDNQTFRVYAGKDFLNFYKALMCSKEYGTGNYIQDFEFNEFIKNDKSGYELENNLHCNVTEVIHMGGAVQAYSFTFIDTKRKSRVIISGDTDKSLPLLSVKIIDDLNAYVFHDMGMTGWGQREDSPHPTEDEVFEAFGYSDRIFGIHTDFDLKIYQKAEVKEYIF